jgi:serine phosphatase RsbU (regulator of sigma subunit)
VCLLSQSEAAAMLKQLAGELDNFEDIARYLLPQPGEIPALRGVDIYGGSLSLNGRVGGDHLIYVDFKQRFDLEARIQRAKEQNRYAVIENLRRCQAKAGIVLIDVSGHKVTDALLAAMLHQAFLLGSTYELDMFGQITRRLFENLNTRFYHSSGEHKFISMIYGEISEQSMFRFLSAGQPFPLVFSREYDRFMDVPQDLCVSFPPLGLLPSMGVIDRNMTTSILGFKEHYEMNEWVLMSPGDILLMGTDGLTEHSRGEESYSPDYLEQKLRDVKDGSAREIFEAIQQDLLAFSPPSDDVSVVVIKRTSHHRT